jgi:hypothetical protein
MPSVYHLHSTPNRPQLGITTPSASPARVFISSQARLAESDMAGTTCTCGHELFDGRGRCPACFEHQQKRHYRLSGRAAQQPPTPPPSQPASPRGSIERGMSPMSTFYTTRTGIGSPASATINSVLAPDSPDDLENDHAEIFLPHIYRTSKRRNSPAAAQSLPRPTRTSTIRHSDDQSGPVVEQLRAGTASPVAGAGSSPDRAYSPMAAGFASIKRRETREQELAEEKRMSQRGSFELAARMFDGPA